MGQFNFVSLYFGRKAFVIMLIVNKYICIILVGESIPGSLIYVGADDMAEAGRFRWVNGERVQRFSSVQSDKYIGNQHCLAIMKSNGVLRDVRCSTALLFLCQKN